MQCQSKGVQSKAWLSLHNSPACAPPSRSSGRGHAILYICANQLTIAYTIHVQMYFIQYEYNDFCKITIDFVIFKLELMKWQKLGYNSIIYSLLISFDEFQNSINSKRPLGHSPFTPAHTYPAHTFPHFCPLHLTFVIYLYFSAHFYFIRMECEELFSETNIKLLKEFIFIQIVHHYTNSKRCAIY